MRKDSLKKVCYRLNNGACHRTRIKGRLAKTSQAKVKQRDLFEVIGNHQPLSQTAMALQPSGVRKELDIELK